MKISEKVLSIMKESVNDRPYEIGGILGSSDGETIDCMILDSPDAESLRRCSYEPNVEYLNRSIASWQKNGVSFKGIFHTHFFGVRSLSPGDRNYIDAIMFAMPPQVEHLYFPVFVLPDCELVCYLATMKNNTVHIREDSLTVIENNTV